MLPARSSSTVSAMPASSPQMRLARRYEGHSAVHSRGRRQAAHESGDRRVAILAGAVIVKRPLLHRRVVPVVRKLQHHGVTGTAVRAVDIRITIARGSRDRTIPGGSRRTPADRAKSALSAGPFAGFRRIVKSFSPAGSAFRTSISVILRRRGRSVFRDRTKASIAGPAPSR